MSTPVKEKRSEEAENGKVSLHLNHLKYLVEIWSFFNARLAPKYGGLAYQ